MRPQTEPRTTGVSWPIRWAAAGAACFPLALAVPLGNFPHDQYFFLPLHTALELMGICVAGLALGITVAGRRYRSSTDDVLFGYAFVAIALLDLAHTFSYDGWPPFITPNNAAKAVFFRLAASLLVALALCFSSLEPVRRQIAATRERIVLLGMLVLTALFYWIGIWHNDQLPLLLDDGAPRSLFKLACDSALAVLDVFAVLLLTRAAIRGRGMSKAWLATAAMMLVFSEVFFGTADTGNMHWVFGHVYKLVGYLMVFRALVYSAFEQPYRLLERERTLLRTLYDTLPDVVWLKDTRGILVASNPAHSVLLGRPESELVGKSVTDLFDTPTAQLMMAHDRRTLESGVVSTEERVLTDAQGRRRHLEVTKVPLYDEDGNPSGILGVARDVTERVLSQMDLRARDELLRKLSKQVPGMIYQFQMHADGHWSLPFASEAIKTIYEVEPTEPRANAENCMARIHPDDIEQIRQSVVDSAATLTPWRAEYRVILPRQGLRWREGHAMPEPQADAGIVWHGYIDDITERKAARDRLQLLASVFENSHEGIVLSDINGIVLDVNDAYTTITGYAREEAVGKKAPFNAQSKFHLIEPEIRKALQESGYWEGEIWEYRKNGEPFAQRVTLRAVCGPDGNFSHFISVSTDITELKHQQQRLERLAHFDALTELPNRVLLADRMRQGMAHARRENRLLAVCYLDLDGFKPVNDRFGHQTGDNVLIEVAQRLKESLRETDSVARLGGDEFVLLLSDLDGEKHYEEILTRVLTAISAPYTIDGVPVTLSASIGVSLFPNDSADPDHLLRQADQALYQAKQGGRNRFQLFDDEQDRRVRGHLDAVKRIEQGLRDGEFRLYYEPHVDMRSGQVLGVEALIRWQHPQRGLLPPAEFLPLIGDSDLAVEMGDWVLDTALGQMEQWWRNGLKLMVSINIAGVHLQQDGFAPRLQQLLKRHPDAPPEHVSIEILETAAITDIQRVSAIMEDCLRLGVSFALDDFGTGYSSLTYLRRLPARTLKIDRSFVRDMLSDPEDLTIVEGIIGLARAFQRQVVAEGVENPQLGAALLALGCTEAQGYGIARPMPAEQLPEWIASWRAHPSWLVESTGPRLAARGGTTR